MEHRRLNISRMDKEKNNSAIIRMEYKSLLRIFYARLFLDHMNFCKTVIILYINSQR
jgi:hypothetical protein